MLNLPYQDNYFDCVYCVEALEHSIRHDVAISEMVRALKSGGTIIIVDKNRDHLGLMQMPEWEQWFGAEQVAQELDKHCKSVSYKFFGLSDTPDDLFIAWTGVKR